MPLSPYTHARIALGSMHRKEQAIAPVFARELQATIIVDTAIDTDAFGTFTPEIPRLGTMLDTARRKAHTACEHTGLALGVASEGSFTPHPQLPWAMIDRELVLFIDLDAEREILGYFETTRTPAAITPLTHEEELLQKAAYCGFPECGVVLRASDTSWQQKGLTTEQDLREALKLAEANGIHFPFLLETDLRAHMNPPRMRAISTATEQLAQNILRTCPHCGSPGFSWVGSVPGAPCTVCRTPTSLPSHDQYRCCMPTCRYEESRIHLPSLADPSFCPTCNP